MVLLRKSIPQNHNLQAAVEHGVRFSMGSKLPPQELELYLALDKLLLREWDPIGISDCEGAEDEYHGYLPKVFTMVMSNSNAAEIAQYLNWVVTDRMSMNGNFQHSLNIAEKCLQAKTNAGL